MIFGFADCHLDVARHRMTRAGERVPIEPQVFDLLHLLLRHAGELVTKDDLIDAIWGGRIVSESAISARISALRRAVGDTGERQAIIRTIPRRGLMFVADVEVDSESGSQTATPASVSLPPAEIRYARSADGTAIAYFVMGDGPPIVRVAHFPSSCEAEVRNPIDVPLFAELLRDHRLIRMDYRGSGLSDHSAPNIEIAGGADDLLAVVDAAGLDRFVLLGQSSGAMVAVDFAARYPDRVTRLILQGGYVDGRGFRAAMSPEEETSIEMMIREGWAQPGSPFVEGYVSLYFPDVPRDVVELGARDLQSSTRVENVLAYRRSRLFYSIADRLADVTMPSLVIHSNGDPVHPQSEAMKLSRGLPDARLVLIDSRNHYVMSHEPSWPQFLDALHGFLNEDR